MRVVCACLLRPILPLFCPVGANAGRNQPLALDLHYLLTAYGAEDLHAELLLGYAMQLLHETPVLTRQSIRTALLPSPVNGSILPAALQALSASDLADQVDHGRAVGPDVAEQVLETGVGVQVFGPGGELLGQVE